MTAIRLATTEDLTLVSEMVAAFHQEEGIASTTEKFEIALRQRLEGNPYGAGYMIGARNVPMGYIVLSFIWSVEHGGLEELVNEVYLRHCIREKGIGKSILKSRFCMTAAYGVYSLSLYVNQKSSKSIQFSKALGFRLCQNHNLTAMEV